MAKEFGLSTNTLTEWTRHYHNIRLLAWDATDFRQFINNIATAPIRRTRLDTIVDSINAGLTRYSCITTDSAKMTDSTRTLLYFSPEHWADQPTTFIIISVTPPSCFLKHHIALHYPFKLVLRLINLEPSSEKERYISPADSN